MTSDDFTLVVSWHRQRIHKGTHRIGEGSWWVTQCGNVGTPPPSNGVSYKACKRCWPIIRRR